jgi:hypothetical protein
MTSNSKKNTPQKADEVVMSGVLTILEKENVWSGTMTDLTSRLVRVVGKKMATMLPASPSALRVVLNRVVNRLRNKKVSIKFGRSADYNRTRYVKFSG